MLLDQSCFDKRLQFLFFATNKNESVCVCGGRPSYDHISVTSVKCQSLSLSLSAAMSGSDVRVRLCQHPSIHPCVVGRRSHTHHMRRPSSVNTISLTDVKEAVIKASDATAGRDLCSVSWETGSTCLSLNAGIEPEPPLQSKILVRRVTDNQRVNCWSV